MFQELIDVLPGAVQPLAEESGPINDIGNWVFHETARQVKHWRTTHAPLFQISVNKSPVQFWPQNVHFNADWLAHLAEMSLHGQSISIEIADDLALCEAIIVGKSRCAENYKQTYHALPRRKSGAPAFSSGCRY